MANLKKKYSVGAIAWSTFGSVIIAMIFSSLIIFSIGAVSTNPVWLGVVQVLALLVFVPMIYSPSWYCGDHDSNSVQFGHMQEDLNKGIRIGFITMIPFALTPIILILSKLQVLPNGFDLSFVYRILNVHLLYAINSLLPPDVATVDASWWSILVVWLFHLILPLTCAVAYRLGYMHISLSERLIFKNLPKAQNHRKK